MRTRMIVQLIASITVGILGSIGRCAETDQTLVASYNFDEGSGAIAHDGSGNGNDGKLHGVRWVKRARGYALSFDGVDDYVDCGNGPSLNLRKAVTLEAWVKPDSLPANEPMIIGKYYDSFGLTQYRDGNAWFYISGGGNNVNGPLEVGVWSHVVGTFDGVNMTLFINGKRVAGKKSKASAIASGKNFLMGVLVADPNATDPGYSPTAHWKGELDEVRVYNRALSEDEVINHYKLAAAGYGVDTTWFDKVKIMLYPFRSEKRVLALFDYGGIFPLPADATLDATLSQRGKEEPVWRQSFSQLSSTTTQFAYFSMEGLPRGEYVVQARLTTSRGQTFEGSGVFHYPPPLLEVPPPSKKQVGPLPPVPRPPRFSLQVCPNGGLVIAVGEHRFPVESSFSFPYGGENRLGTDADAHEAEPEWKVSTKQLSPDRFTITAKGKYYTIERRVERHHNRVSIRDTVRNSTAEDLGIIINHFLDASAHPYQTRRVSGYLGAVERRESQSPTVFMTWEDCGIGLVPLDDVLIVHSTLYARDNRAGILDDRFGLPPGVAYTMEWAIYPTASTNYYDFINEVRRDEKRNGVTVEGGFAFVPRQPFSREYAEIRNLLYASFGCLTNVADDPEIEIEGIEFLTLPKERARIRSQFEDIRKINPHLKLMFHVAHSLWATNKPAETFPDSRVIDANGNHVIYPYDYDACTYFSPQRHREGWRWYIYYPTPGNSFHDALLKSVDVMIDEIGCNGAFMDGFFYGYGSGLTYDRWDGHTVEIDPQTKTIKRKVGSVLLLSQPSMVEFAKKMLARGAVVIANNVIQTRTISSLPIIVDQECRSGPDVHLAQTPCALGNPPRIRNEVDLYRDVLEKLRWGNLYFYYGEPALTYPSLPQQMFPITVEEIQAGMVKGKERIVTMNSGVYGWAGGRELHYCYRYNSVGISIPADFLTTVDASGVRTEVRLQQDESAVIKRIPVTLRTNSPVNLMCEQFNAEGIVLSLNGRGKVQIVVRTGDFKIEPGKAYRVSGLAHPLVASQSGVLVVPLVLDGSAKVKIAAMN